MVAQIFIHGAFSVFADRDGPHSLPRPISTDLNKESWDKWRDFWTERLRLCQETPYVGKEVKYHLEQFIEEMNKVHRIHQFERLKWYQRTIRHQARLRRERTIKEREIEDDGLNLYRLRLHAANDNIQGSRDGLVLNHWKRRCEDTAGVASF